MVADLQTMRDRRRAEALAAREVADMRAVIDDAPAVTAGNCLWWCFVRAPEAFEVESITPDLAVVAAAVAEGLSLQFERRIFRRISGEPMPLDRAVMAELIRREEAEFVGFAPRAKDAPKIGLRLCVALEECAENERIVSMQGGTT